MPYIDSEALKKKIFPYGMADNGNYGINAKSVMVAIEDAPAVDALVIPEGGVGEASDGYHTFNELYHHRAILFSVICNANPDKAWKSKLHDTEDMFEGMFIVGIETPHGQATYHYDIEPYWDMFKVKELEKAPEWDGHTPEQAIERIGALSRGLQTVADNLLDEAISIFCDKYCRHPLECQSQDELDNHCDNCDFIKVLNIFAR